MPPLPPSLPADVPPDPRRHRPRVTSGGSVGAALTMLGVSESEAAAFATRHDARTTTAAIDACTDAIAFFGADGANRWMRRRSSAIEGRTPLECVLAGDAAAVAELIARLRYGIVA